MLDLQLIRKIVDMMVDRDLCEIELRDGDQHLVIKRSLPQMIAAGGAAAALPNPASSNPPTPEAAAAKASADHEAELTPIKSPMVGTFYAAPDPESPHYVTIGSAVGPDSVVCIIEAMKVFNEIKAEVAGVIERILVQNEQPVEFGQPMFLVRPS